MKKIIIVRHGDYSGSNLTTLGVNQMETLAGFLSWVNPTQTTMLSSSASRASNSARILSEKLGLPFTEHYGLWSDDDHDYDLRFASQLIKSQDSEAVILITHLEYAQYLPKFICKDIFGNTELMNGYSGLYKGQMVLINLEKKCYETFSG